MKLPPNPKPSRRVFVSAQVPKADHDAIALEAALNGRTVSQELRYRLATLISRRKNSTAV